VANTKNRIAIVFTGGTISMQRDTRGGVVPALSPDEILQLMPDVHDIADLEITEFGRYPGPHITPELMLDLSHIVQSLAAQPAVHGIVITHGTDTLEETAYFLDCTLNTPKPVVIVGSMRNSSESDWDGPRNLRDAILVACNPKAYGMGVVVCLADTVQAASEVSKMDTSNIKTFESSNFGPLGRIINGSVLLYRHPVRRDTFAVKHLPRFVPIIKCYTAGEAELLRLALDAEIPPEGIVLEAMGVGNVPPPVFHQILRALEKNIPVVLTSRCPIGRVEYFYAYEGAGKQLHEAGVIFADYLTGPKARIKLIIALGAASSRDEIRASFEWGQ
jgi:L-asparaginase